MTFSVEPIALHGYAALLGRASSDAEQCKTYFTANVPTLSPVAEGLINPLCYEHAGVQQKVGAMLDHLVTLLGESRDEMAETATRYAQSDDAAAAKLDDSYPETVRPPLRRD
ncbi:hypothetical protein [Paractinoplanes toevensis]|uniref:Uncharacterized protein n=1 Tax=Paractinoplanes toevensis TaxID=571911 RepID=A0A920BRJ0_9ACTN|nr:hypothetical protein [Actinoplanes toevensis]GIM98070.1 hypothetical protein Ato02nite_098630 [Actinoplanes toevensis]